MELVLNFKTHTDLLNESTFGGIVQVKFCDPNIPRPPVTAYGSWEHLVFYCSWYRSSDASAILPLPGHLCVDQVAPPAKAHDGENQKAIPPLNVVSLFSGCGGMDEGLKQAGGNILACVEMNAACLATLEHNQGGKTRIFNCGIDKFNKAIQDGNPAVDFEHKVDLVAGGPPCQGFSNANSKAGVSDTRNLLIVEFLRTVALLQPTFVLMENVPPFLEVADGLFLANTVRALQRLGYQVRVMVMRMSCYGVPQDRRRVIFTGALEGHSLPSLPRPTFSQLPQKIGRASTFSFSASLLRQNVMQYGFHALLSPAIVANVFCGDLEPPLVGGTRASEKRCGICAGERPKNFVDVADGNKELTMCDICVFTYPRLYTKSVDEVPALTRLLRTKAPNAGDPVQNHCFSRIGGGLRLSEPLLDFNAPARTVLASSASRLVYPETHPEWPKPTLKKSSYGPSNPLDPEKGYRGTTVREDARLQTFPDEFIFVHYKKEELYRMIGNAVPPLFASVLGRQMLHRPPRNGDMREDLATRLENVLSFAFSKEDYHSYDGAVDVDEPSTKPIDEEEHDFDDEVAALANNVDPSSPFPSVNELPPMCLLQEGASMADIIRNVNEVICRQNALISLLHNIAPKKKGD